MYTGYDCIQWFMKVRDHCHVTKKYNDSTHIECNTNFQDSFVISSCIISSYNILTPITIRKTIYNINKVNKKGF